MQTTLTTWSRHLLRKSCTRNYATTVTTHLTGQPFPKTHPHLFDKQDAVAVGGFDKTDFQERRFRFAEQMYDDSIAFIQSSDRHLMTNDIPYPYRQNNDFYYLTGFNEPGACLVIQKSKTVTCKLYVRPKDDYREKWDGPRTGVLNTQKYLGIDVDEDKNAIQHLRSNQTFAYVYVEPSMTQFNNPEDNNLSIRSRISEFIQSNKKTTLVNHRNIMDHLRKIKSPKDVAMLLKAANISAHAFQAAMVATKPGVSEAHIEAVLEFEARLRGAQRLSYPPVVAGGNRASIIHYVLNNQVLDSNDMLLVDAGSEYYNYSSDITRTWPVSGRFSKPQKLVYEAVLRVQESCIEAIRNRQVQSLPELHRFSVERTKEEIQEFGGFSMFSRSQIAHVTEALYPHSIGHPMGMDIHEDFPRGEKFVPGMCVTVEPGIYIPHELVEDSNIPVDHYKQLGLFGIGVRIEDDILITEKGIRVLTKDTPKTVEEIEYLMNNGRTDYEHLKNHVQQCFNF